MNRCVVHRINTARTQTRIQANVQTTNQGLRCETEDTSVCVHSVSERACHMMCMNSTCMCTVSASLNALVKSCVVAQEGLPAIRLGSSWRTCHKQRRNSKELGRGVDHIWRLSSNRCRLGIGGHHTWRLLSQDTPICKCADHTLRPKSRNARIINCVPSLNAPVIQDAPIIEDFTHKVSP